MRIRRNLLLVGLGGAFGMCLALLVHSLLPSAAADEAGKNRARLLIRCDASEVIAVLRALEGRDVEVYDLDSMGRLAVSSTASNAPSTAARSVPRVPDAAVVMDEMLRALATVKDGAGGQALRIESMSIQERRAMVRIEAASQTEIDRAVKVLRANAYLRARGREGGMPELGSMQRSAGGGLRTVVSFRFREDAADGRPPLPPLTSLPTTHIERAERTARMQKMYASPLRDDPNRRAGYRTITRQYTYEATNLETLRGLIRELTQVHGKPNGLTVSEIRWKLVDPKERVGEKPGQIRKPVIQVGYRTPLR